MAHRGSLHRQNCIELQYIYIYIYIYVYIICINTWYFPTCQTIPSAICYNTTFLSGYQPYLLIIYDCLSSLQGIIGRLPLKKGFGGTPSCRRPLWLVPLLLPRVSEPLQPRSAGPQPEVTRLCCHRPTVIRINSCIIIYNPMKRYKIINWKIILQKSKRKQKKAIILASPGV